MVEPSAFQTPLDAAAIKRWLPHREPCLLIDRLIAWEPSRFALGRMSLDAVAPVFTGHFPGQPILPGVLIIEALAQVGALLWTLSHNRPKDTLWLAGVERCRFRRPVSPGDEVELLIENPRLQSRGGRVSGRASVAGHIVCESDLLFVRPTAAQAEEHPCVP